MFSTFSRRGVVAAVALLLLAVVATFVTVSPHVRRTLTPPSFRIYYGIDLARANPMLRMCVEAGAECEWVTNSSAVLSVVSCREGEGQHHVQGVGTGDTFAPPVLEDISAGGKLISQSVASSLYMAERIGFGVGPDAWRSAKAVQYMADLNDMQSELIDRYSDYWKAGGDWGRMRTWNEGGRLASWLTNIERSIASPFYFGDALTAPDFYLVGVMGYMEVMNPAFRKNLLADYPKASAVVAAVTALPGWQASSWKDRPILMLPALSEAQLAAYEAMPVST